MSGARSPPLEAGRGRHGNTAGNHTIGPQHNQRVRPTSMFGSYVIDSLDFLGKGSTGRARRLWGEQRDRQPQRYPSPTHDPVGHLW